MLSPDSIFKNGPRELTPSQAKAVDYILSEPEEVVFLSAVQLAGRLGLSDATIVRLSQSLGFAGYTDLKNHLRTQLMARLDTVTRLKSSAVKIRTVADVLPAVLGADRANLKALAQTVSAGTFVQVVEELHGRDKMHLIGLRSAHTLAVFLTSAMRYLGREVHLITPGVGDIWADLGTLDSGALLVAFSFPRYTSLTVEITEYFKEAGAFVISLTDSAQSPLARLSDYSLYCPFRIESHMESFVSALSLLNALVTGVAFLDGDKSITGLRRMEELWENRGIYYKNQSTQEKKPK